MDVKREEIQAGETNREIKSEWKLKTCIWTMAREKKGETQMNAEVEMSEFDYKPKCKGQVKAKTGFLCFSPR